MTALSGEYSRDSLCSPSLEILTGSLDFRCVIVLSQPNVQVWYEVLLEVCTSVEATAHRLQQLFLQGRVWGTPLQRGNSSPMMKECLILLVFADWKERPGPQEVW